MIFKKVRWRSDGDSIFGNCFTYLADGEAGTFLKYAKIFRYPQFQKMRKQQRYFLSMKHIKEYDENKRYCVIQEKVEQLAHLRAGECLITFPEDLKSTKGSRVNDDPVKKSRFKVAVCKRKEITMKKI